MKKLGKIKMLVAMLICVCTLFTMGTTIAFASEDGSATQTYNFGDLPYHTGYSNFGYYDAGMVEYTLKVGWFDASKADFNLKAFDTWDGNNLVTLSTMPGMHAENWKWAFAKDTSIVLELKSKVNGTIQFDFSNTKLGGWMDAWPSIFGLYRYNASTATVDTIARNFENDSAKPLDSATYNHTVEVKKGDRVFFEIGKNATNDYNVQDIHSAKIIVKSVAVEEPAKTTLNETYSFNDLPYHTGYSEFGYYNAGFVDYTLKVGLFDASKENYNLKAFDTWDGSNLLTLSTIPGMHAENWKWAFAENTSIVLQVKSKINGTIKFDFTGVTLGGWMDAWPSIFGLYRYNASTATVETLARNYQNDSAKPLDSATYTHTVEVKEGDVVYFEIGKYNSNGYNIQEMQYGKIIASTSEVSSIVIAPYAKKLDDKVAGLVQDTYAENDWNAIAQIVETFKTTAHESIDAMVVAYEKAVADIDAITPDPLKAKKASLIKAMNEYFASLVQANYAESDWAIITGAKDAFLSGIEACATQEDAQALYDAKFGEISAIKPDPLKDKRTNLINAINAYVEGLEEDDYKQADWTAIITAKNAFVSGAENCATESELQALYDAKMAEISAISPDLLKDERKQLIAIITDYVGGLVQANYTENDWNVINTAKEAFINNAEACATESELQALYDAKMAEIKAVKAYKQSITYLDYPSKMNANGYDWIKGDVFDTKLFAGTVENMKEFDTQGSSNNIMYNASLNAGYESPAYYAENWKWYIGYNMGVITAYQAKVDMQLVIINTYLADGYASNGWTEETVLTYYIVRGESIKKIKEVNAPSSDADFGGTFYLKAGDMLYIEFNSTIINVGETRNTESPCGMKAYADSTAFNQDFYAEQNHDLPVEVVNAINAKKIALEEYYASLKQEDYSATNWLTIGQYIEQYVEKCETEVETVEDVEALYNSIKAEMQAVPTLAQAQEELKKALQGYVDELQAQYDALISANKYTTENKAVLDKALADGKAKILSAKSKTVGNQEKVKAIATLKAVEVHVEEKAGCKSSLFGGSLIGSLAVVAGLFFVRKRK